VPYYGTSSSNHKARLGSRRMMPARSRGDSQGGDGPPLRELPPEGNPAQFYTRVMEPEKNNFLLAPLAESAGGTGRCGEAIFATKDDPDYRKILDTFSSIHRLLKDRPRADMPEYEERCEKK
jgi:hypothetical protein